LVVLNNIFFVIKELAPDEENFYFEGAREVEEEIGKLQKTSSCLNFL